MAGRCGIISIYWRDPSIVHSRELMIMAVVSAITFIITIAIMVVIINAMFLGAELIRDRLSAGEKEPITK